MLDDEFIPIGRGSADIGLGIAFIPGAQPYGYGVSFGAAHIQPLAILQSFFQFPLDLRLDFTQHIFNDILASFGIVPGRCSGSSCGLPSVFRCCSPASSFLCREVLPPGLLPCRPAVFLSSQKSTDRLLPTLLQCPRLI